jgi:signal transduction histidine kinase/ActR/RegA family two-component response regulator
MAVPVLSEKTVVGIINAMTFTPDRVFGESEIAILTTFADFVGIAYRNASLYKRERIHNLELRQLQAETEQNQLLVETVLEQMVDALLVVNIEGIIIRSNHTAGIYFRRPYQELIGTHLDKIRILFRRLDGKPITSENCLINRSMYTGETITNEDVLCKVGDETQILNMNIAPYHNEAHLIAGVVVTLHDVTKIREDQEFDSHQERLRSLGQLSSGVAHDLNNLLSSIMGAADIISRELETSNITNNRLNEAVKLIQQVGQDGAEMVRRIQTFSRTTQAGTDEPVSLALISHEALKLTESRWKSEAAIRGVGISIEANVPDDLFVLGNATELRELFINLILNSVDALGKRGGHISIRGEIESGNIILVEVADNGIGIPPHLKNRIFDPFFTTKGQAGTGLGLAIVHNIVDRLGGTVSLDSLPEHGTTFFIRLPACETPAVVPQLEAESEAIDSPDLKLHLRIMAIDDEPVLSRILGRMLENMNHAVVTFNDPADALELLEKNPDAFDVVITDLGMPKLTGWDVTKRVKELNPEIAVILVTGWFIEDSNNSVRERGADMLITKPYTSQHLQKALEIVSLPSHSKARLSN